MLWFGYLSGELIQIFRFVINQITDNTLKQTVEIEDKSIVDILSFEYISKKSAHLNHLNLVKPILAINIFFHNGTNTQIISANIF